MTATLAFIIILVILALVFDYINGFHDAAKSIGDGVRMDLISADLRLYVLLAALLGAIIWNLITWYLGLPTSSSHALLGGYAGAGIAAYGGVIGLLKAEVWLRVLMFIVLSPL